MNSFSPNRVSAGKSDGGQFAPKTNSEQDIELDSIDKAPEQVRIGNQLVDEADVDRIVTDAIDDAIDKAVRTARENEGVDIFPACYDREQLEETLGEDLRSSILEHGEDLSLDRNRNISAEAALMNSPSLRYDCVTDYLNEAYTDPGSHADDWTSKHLKSTQRWVEDFIRAENADELEPEWKDLANWNVEGAVEHVNSHIQELAEDGKLDLEEGPKHVFGNGEHFGDFYTRLMDKYYTAPDTDRWS